MENAASALTQLCATRANQDAIADAGGIQLLVNVLTKSSNGMKPQPSLCAAWQPVLSGS